MDDWEKQFALDRIGRRVALCHGCFDGLHPGHVELFRKARELADIVLVGVESDSYIEIIKKRCPPFFSLDDRMQRVKETGSVDYVFCIPWSNSFPKNYAMLYRNIRPNVIVTSVDEGVSLKERDAQQFGIDVVKMVKKFSSTRIFQPK